MNNKNNFNRRQALKAAAMCALSLPAIGLAATRAADSDSSPKAPAHDTALKLGIASYSLVKYPVEKVIEVLKQLDITSASLYRNHAPWATGTPEACKAVAQMFFGAGIAVTSTGVIDLTTDEAAARKAFENVKAAGVPMICGRPVHDALPLVDKLVKEYDVKVAIHNHGPSDLYPSGEVVWNSIQNFDERIGLCLDVGHAWRAGADPAAEIRKCRTRLYELHLKDTLGPGGVATKDPSPVIVGHGKLDIRLILAALVEIKYPYRVEFEYEQHVDDKVPGLAESVGYVRGMLAGIAA